MLLAGVRLQYTTGAGLLLLLLAGVGVCWFFLGGGTPPEYVVLQRAAVKQDPQF